MGARAKSARSDGGFEPMNVAEDASPAEEKGKKKATRFGSRLGIKTCARSPRRAVRRAAGSYAGVALVPLASPCPRRGFLSGALPAR